MTDVERVLLVLLPALSLVTGCDKNKSPGSNEVEVAEAENDEVAEQTTKVRSEEAGGGGEGDEQGDGGQAEGSAPEGETEDDPPENGTGGSKTGTTTGVSPERLPDEMYMPSCPTFTWCGTKTHSDSIADKDKAGEGRTLGCVALVRPAPDDLSKPRYEGLGPEPAYFDKPATETKRKEGTQDQCCYTWTEPCPGGRPLLDTAGEAVVAPARAGRPAVGPSDRDPGHRDPVAAAAWLADAAMEHASVASFNRAALELLSVGAPLDLVRRCQEAALDELRHVETCLALARRCGASAEGFGALPLPELRAPDLARLAADTFAEGCVGETVATLAMQRAASAVRDPSVGSELDQVAQDELRHAELAWETVTWAVRTGGRDVLAAVLDRAGALRPNLDAALPPGSDGRRSADTGRLDARSSTLAARDAWQRIIDPMLDALRESARPAALA